jgi:hypothetical protein
MYPRKEPSPAKPFLSSVQQKKVYTKPLEFRTKPYQLLGFGTKSETLNVSYFPTKPFSAVWNFKKDFEGEGSSRGYMGRTFKKGVVENHGFSLTLEML